MANARDSKYPVLLVSINYRLGIFGFAFSDDLTEEGKGGSKESPIGNYGLVDQRNALEWINAHIQDFGGDPNQITVFGVSAGGLSIHMHLLAEHALFDRAIMMSGIGPVISPISGQFHQSQWDSLCALLGIEAESWAERMEKLREVSTLDMLNSSGTATLGPVADGQLLHEGWHYEDHMSNKRCKDIIVGDTNVEALIFDGLITKLPQAKFHEAVEATFSPSFAEELYSQFGFTKEPQSFEDFRKAFRLLAGNVFFNYNNVGLAKASCSSDAWRDHVYLYHFEIPSPFPGPTFGYSYHGLCALLMHLNEFKACPAEAQIASKEAAKLFAVFASGKEPWEPYSKNEKFMRIGPKASCDMHTFKSDDTRNYAFHEWLGAHIYEVGRFVRRTMANCEK